MNLDIGETGYAEVMDFFKKRVNIRVVDTTGFKSRCIVYASANGVWHPNSPEVFHKRILKNDEFEWTRRGIAADRIIYIRDILKEWYVNGIGKEVDSIDRLIEYIRSFVFEYREIICIGSSAGGYISTILGIALKASYIISNSGQIDISQYAEMEREYPELYHAIVNVTSNCACNFNQ